MEKQLCCLPDRETPQGLLCSRLQGFRSSDPWPSTAAFTPQRSASDASACALDSPLEGSECAEGHQILVVDDNRDAADSLALLFGTMGAKVSVAYGAKEALTAMRNFHPKIAVIDISMPLMNGYELAAKIRASKSFQGVVLVALTGWGPDAAAKNARETGFDHHFMKPASVHKLALLVGSIA